MRLVKYKVHNFRSVKNTDWIDVAPEVTCFVGPNESGKSNLLIALSMLTEDSGEFDIYKNYPRNQYPEADNENKKSTPFIQALFELDEEKWSSFKEFVNSEHGVTVAGTSLGEAVVTEHWNPLANIKFLLVKKDYNGIVYIYPSDLDGSELGDNLGEETIEPIFNQLLEMVPKFVYYPNYAKLVSGIKLTRVQEILNGDANALSDEERINARNIKILFDYLDLNLEEIINYGHEIDSGQGDQALNKQKRFAKLNSAASRFSKEFHAWRPEENYTFCFQADNQDFRIWVRDSERTTPIELEFRSGGLQWFLSFFLFFSAARKKEEPNNRILLLDEPGLSLHPNAQISLVKFFNQLSEKSQLIYSTHLPFLVDDKNLDRVRVISTENGLTKSSNNINEEPMVIQPLFKAIGIDSSKIYCIGYDVVIVEGSTDEQYLIKIYEYLISKGKLSQKRRFRFSPGQGSSTIGLFAALIYSNNNQRPVVLLDSDASGMSAQRNLKQNLYIQHEGKVLDMSLYAHKGEAQIEDLFPRTLMINTFNALLQEKQFLDGGIKLETFNIDENLSISATIKKFAKDNDIKEKVWECKLEFCLKVIQALDEYLENLGEESAELKELEAMWQKLFDDIQAAAQSE